MTGKIATLAGMLVSVLVFPAIGNAETFYLRDERVIKGDIMGSTPSAIMVMDDRGSLMSLSLTDIAHVEMPIIDREEDLSAELIGWEDGVFEVLSEGFALRVSEGRILSAGQTEAHVEQPLRRQSPSAQQQPSSEPAGSDEQYLSGRPITNPTM